MVDNELWGMTESFYHQVIENEAQVNILIKKETLSEADEIDIQDIYAWNMKKLPMQFGIPTMSRIFI